MTEEDCSLRFAASLYANSAPLAYYICHVSPAARFVEGVPSSSAALLHQGKVDAALIPVAELLANPKLTKVEGIGVCAKQKVQSVLLKCFSPLAQVRRVELDPASRTSNALAAILLRHHLKLSPQMSYPLAQRSGPSDAAVVIGDRALAAPPAPYGDYDLAELWHQMTGLPFVFAVWSYPAGHAQASCLVEIAHLAKQQGVQQLDFFIKHYAETLGLPEERLQEYFHSAIYYDVGPQEERAIRAYAELLPTVAELLSAFPAPPLTGSQDKSETGY